jgi:hypothetical protein
MDLPLLNAVLSSVTKLGEERWYGTVTEKGKPLKFYGIMEDNHANAIPVVDAQGVNSQ